MIQDADVILRELLADELARLPESLITDPDQITFHAPATADTVERKSPGLNLYLYDLRENLALRDEQIHRERGPVRRDPVNPHVMRVGKRPAAVRLDLSYLVTAHANDDAAVEHRLLSEALSVLLRNPVIEMKVPDESKPKSAQVPLTVIQPDHPAYADPAGLWRALGGRLRPAISLVITIPFNPYETKWTQVVREAIFGIGQGLPPDGPRRPLDFSELRVSAAGVVTDADGKNPIPGVLVSVVGRDETAATDEKGFFYILNLQPGSYQLRLTKRGFREHRISVVAPAPGRQDQLEPFVVGLETQTDPERASDETKSQNELAAAAGLVEAGRKVMVSLSGVLRWTRDAEGKENVPAAFIPVRVGHHRTSTDVDGVYCFSNLPAGDHVVIADVPGRGEIEIARENATSSVAGYWETETAGSEKPEVSAPTRRKEGLQKAER